MSKKEEIHILNQDYPEAISDINNQGNVYFNAGKYDKALACFEESLHLKTFFLGKGHLDVADSYNNIGNTYYYKGLYDKALTFHFKSKQIKIQLLGKDNIALAGTYNGIGICYDAQGFYSKALAYYNKSLDLRSRYLGKDDPSLAQNYNNLGLCYFSTGLFDNALIYLNQALQIRQQHYGVEHASVAQTLLNIGACFYRKKECDEALYFYEKSLRIRKVIYGNRHPNVTTALNNIGLCFSCKNQYEKALEYHYEALEIRLQTLGQDHPILGNTYRDIANCLHEMRDFEGALSNLQKALQIVIPDFSPKNNIQNPAIQQYLDAHMLLEILQSKAICLQKMHVEQYQNTEEKYGYQALAIYQLAAKLVEQIRRGYKAESTHLTLAEKAHEMYEAAIETAISNGVIEMAFTFAEQGKGMVLLSSLKDIDARLAANIPEKWLHEANDLRMRLTELDAAIRREHNQVETKRNKENLRTWQNQHFDYQRQYESLIERLEEEFPNYFQLKYDVHTIDLQTLQSSLEEEMAIVEFFVGSKQTYVWVIGRDFVLKEKIALTERDLSEKVEDLIEAIYAENDKDYRRLAYELYALLLEKCLNHPFLKSIKNLQIIPDGNLNFLPFETLLTDFDTTSNAYSDLAYLIKRFGVSYHYSSTLWQYGKRKDNNEMDFTSNFVGFAPVYLSPQPQSEKTYAPLLHSASEITTIKKAFQQKGHKVATYLHLEASKQQFQNQAANYKYVHIAAHAFSQSHFGQEEAHTLDGIVFSSQKNGASSVLTMAEIYNLTLRADLVVLSCCDSGIGKVAKGEGVMAINRGFLYAGAKNVIYTLFKVYDQQSAELMQYLYEEILEGKSYGEALQAAKFKMIAQNLAPKYWSGFVHIGG